MRAFFIFIGIVAVVVVTCLVVKNLDVEVGGDSIVAVKVHHDVPPQVAALQDRLVRLEKAIEEAREEGFNSTVVALEAKKKRLEGQITALLAQAKKPPTPPPVQPPQPTVVQTEDKSCRVSIWLRLVILALWIGLFKGLMMWKLNEVEYPFLPFIVMAFVMPLDAFHFHLFWGWLAFAVIWWFGQNPNYGDKEWRWDSTPVTNVLRFAFCAAGVIIGLLWVLPEIGGSNWLPYVLPSVHG